MRSCIVTSVLLLSFFAQTGFAQTAHEIDARPISERRVPFNRLGARLGWPAKDGVRRRTIGGTEASAHRYSLRVVIADTFAAREIPLGRPLTDRCPAALPLIDRMATNPASESLYIPDPGLTLHQTIADR